MSGIVGIWNRDGRPVGPPLLAQMNATLSHRGPNGSGLWIDGSIGLGHHMLWTTPESLSEALPLAADGGKYAVTADCRIDNREELIGVLGVKQFHGEIIPDSTLVLEAYRRWGDRCPERLLGDFVFAIWDGPRQQLFCARDPMGLRPFYYYRSSSVFVFASEIKALLCSPEVPRRINEHRVAEYLAERFDQHTNTFYEEILRLPGGHCISVGRERFQLRRYWSLDPTREIRRGSNAEYAEELREIFTEAVRCRLRSAFPVGSTLSGGLDSSSVVCTARKLFGDAAGQRLHTFSAIYPGVPRTDERSFIQAVVDGGGLQPHFVQPMNVNPLADLDESLWRHDEPVWWPTWSMERALYAAVQEHDIRILLGGRGGDQAISNGNPFFAELLRSGRWLRLAREVGAYAEQFRLSRRDAGNFFFHRAARPVLRSLVPEPMLRVRRWIQGGVGTFTHPVLNPDLDRRLEFSQRSRARDVEQSRLEETVRGDHYLSLVDGLTSFAHEQGDKAAIGFSIRRSFPFADTRLLEFSLALPADQKVSQGWTRVVMRRAMEGILPPQVQWRRSKAVFDPLLNYTLLAYSRDLLDEVVGQSSAILQPWVNMSFLRQVHSRFTALGPDDARSLQTAHDARMLLVAVTLARWLESTNTGAS